LILWCSPTFTLQFSDCITFLMMYNDPSRVIFIENLLKSFLVLFTDISIALQLQFQWPQ
jgi:hypothetical protein